MSAVSQLISDLDEKSAKAEGDAIKLIKADHRAVEMLFAEYEKSKSKTDKKALLDKIVEELNVHTTAEEKLIYPPMDKADHEGTSEAFEEHHIVENCLKELMQVTEIDDLVDAKVQVLSELVKHHVKEEETTLLPELKKSGADLNELGSEFKAEKERLQSKAPKPGQANTNAKEFKRKVG